MAENLPLRFGLVGYGAWGSHHARAITSVDGAVLVAIAGHSAASCERARADHPAAAVYDDYRRMLAAERLDAVAVVVPSHLHSEIASAVLSAGCHLLLEKPMALTVDDCTRLVELARSQNRLLAVGHELRMSSLWGRVKQLVDDGAIGTPQYALVELWRRPYRLGSDGWRYDPQRVGDWILEEPIHFFDLARWYFAACGEPVAIGAEASGGPGGAMHDNFSATLSFKGGSYAVVSQSLAGWEHHQSVKLTGNGGALWARWSGAMDRTFEPTFNLQLRRDEQLEDVPIAKPSGEVYELVDQLAMFVRAIRDGGPLACSGQDGRRSVAMCLAAAESLRLGRPVKLSAD